MKILIQALVAITLPILFVASCTVTGIYTSLAISHLQAEHYADGDSVNRRFLVLVASPGKQATGEEATHYKRWYGLDTTQWQDWRQNHPSHSLHLLKKEGVLPGCDLRPKLSVRPRRHQCVRFTVLKEGEAGQVIEVVHEDLDYTFYSRYEATDNRITPRSFRVRHAAYEFAWLPIGLTLTLLLWYGAQTVVRRRLKRLAPDLDAHTFGLLKATSELLFLMIQRAQKTRPVP